ncbi:MAG: hypothetical protein WA188_21570 [Terriglobales bacterium]
MGLNAAEPNEDGLSLADAADAWLADVKVTKKPKTHVAYRTSVEYFLKSCNKPRVANVERVRLAT